MSDDLVKLLRVHGGAVSRAAADRIEALEAELANAKDRLALELAICDGAHRRAREAAADRDAWKANAERLAGFLAYAVEDESEFDTEWDVDARAALAAHNKQKDGEA
jgi:hypothetical protein